MAVNLSQFSTYIWFLAAILGIVVAFAVIRFFWRHLLKYIFQGCLAVVGIIILLAILRYLFKLF